MKQKGLTLLEILISAAILAAIMLGVVNIFLAGKRHILHARSRVQVAELTKFFLNPLYLQVRADEWGTNCLGSSTGCAWTESLDNINWSPTWSITDVGGTRLRRVQLTINWEEPTP